MNLLSFNKTIAYLMVLYCVFSSWLFDKYLFISIYSKIVCICFQFNISIVLCILVELSAGIAALVLKDPVSIVTKFST